jgi:hypothetical protein
MKLGAIQLAVPRQGVGASIGQLSLVTDPMS